MEFRGWFVTERSGTKIEIARNGSVVCSLEIDQVRPDVRQVFPEASERCGFLGRASIEGWSENRFDVRAVFPARAPAALESIRARRIWREDADRRGPRFVSVVIRAVRGTAEATGAIESALGQTYPHFEILVVGPAPHLDRSALGSRFEAVREIPTRETGIASLNNLAIRRSIGEFLLFMDADDRLAPEAIGNALTLFGDRPENGIATGGAESGTAMFRRSVFETVGVFDGDGPRSEAEFITRFGEQYPVCRSR